MTWPKSHGPRALLRQVYDGCDPQWLAVLDADDLTRTRYTRGASGPCWSINRLRDVGTSMLVDLAAIADAGFEVRIARERAGSGRVKVVIREGVTRGNAA